MIRQIKRNILKRRFGRNDISREWQDLQIKRYGSKELYWAMRKSKLKKRKHKRRRQGK